MAATCADSHWHEKNTSLYSLIYSPKLPLTWKEAEENDPFPNNISECFKHDTREKFRIIWLQLYKYALKANTSPDRLVKLKVFISFSNVAAL